MIRLSARNALTGVEQKAFFRGTDWDNSFTGVNTHVALLALTVDINASISVVLPSASLFHDISVIKKEESANRGLGDVIVEFAEELRKRSRSLSAEDFKLYEKIIQSKLQAGTFDF